VTDSSAFVITPAHSSARGRRELVLPLQGVTRTYEDQGLGLKILVRILVHS
jgi:hypothetical protein